MQLDRRNFLRTALAGGAAIALGAGTAFADEPAELPPLPASDPDPESQFGVDKNINMTTIDQYVCRPDVCYRDMRMLFDPARFGDIGGNADLSTTIKGFRIVPYPYIASLNAMPVGGAYEGETLFTLEWGEDGNVVSATPNYLESYQVIEDLFPKDKPIFLMCGGGGYSGMTKAFLTFMGWDPALIYNTGGNWSYDGDNAVELIVYSEEKDGVDLYATWRADYAFIDFSRLHPVK